MRRKPVKEPVFSVKTLKILLCVNAFCFAASWALAIFFFFYKEYVMAGAMLFIMFLTGKNMISFYRQIKSRKGSANPDQAS